MRYHSPVVVLGSVVLVTGLGCSERIEPWVGVVEAAKVPQYAAFRTKRGKFQSFADCERAMKTDAGETDRSPVPEGFIRRSIYYRCVQGSSEITVATGDLALPKTP